MRRVSKVIVSTPRVVHFSINVVYARMKAKAQIFSTAYFRDDVKNKSNRPISFIFNGGPGSSSVWLHMGIFGPKWVKLPSDAKNPGAPPYELANNPYSLLDVTDLVFIDPVGTGYSKAVGHAKGKDFWGVKELRRTWK